MSDLGVEHTADAECINIHSDKDISVFAVHNRTTDIWNDDLETVTNNKSVTVFDGKSDFTVETGPHTEKVKGAVTETFDDTQTTTVTKEIVITSKAFIHITAADEIQLEVGSSKLIMKKNGQIELTGTLIKVDGSDITLTAKAHIVENGANINSTAKASHNIKGSVVVSEGTTVNVVKGGMVQLNP